MKLIERLHKYIVFKGISLNSFDKAIGASNGYIGKQIKNKASIGGDMIEIIISIYTDLNPEWLITEKGEMIRNNYSNDNSDVGHIVKDVGIEYKKKDRFCKECIDKDRQIEDLQKQLIKVQTEYIEHLKDKERPSKAECPDNKSGQKRKEHC